MATRRRHYRRNAKLAAAFYGGGFHGALAYLKHRYRWFLPTHWYHAAKTNPIKAFSLGTFIVLWKETGHGILAIALTAVIVPAGIAGWYYYRLQKTGLTVKEAAKQLKLQKRVEKKWTQACRAAGISVTERGGQVTIPPLTQIASDKGDVTARVYPGQYAIASKDVSKNLERIAETVGCREVTMRIVSSGVLDLRFCWANPLEKVVKPTDLKVAPKGSIPFGVMADGQPITIPVLNKNGESEFRSTLIGGVPGSGKSSALWAMLVGFIAQDVPVRLWVIDPAGGVELAELGKALREGKGTDTFRVHRYAKNVVEAEALIKEMSAVLDARLESMEAAGIRLHKPTKDEPLEVLVVDELLLCKRLFKTGAESTLGMMHAIWRKAGMGMLACTQLAEKATLGELRELIPMRIAFRMNTRPQTITILGDDQADAGPAHNIPRGLPGMGYMYDAVTDGMRKFRAVRITDLQTRLIAQGIAPEGLENYGKGEPEPVGEHTLYKFFTKPDRHGGRVLLYVGITNDPRRRFAEHAADKKWWKQVDQGAIDLTRFPDRSSALAAETEAIRSQLPRHNKVSNEDNPTRDLDLDEVAA